jgi:uncharacterized protein YwgA
VNRKRRSTRIGLAKWRNAVDGQGPGGLHMTRYQLAKLVEWAGTLNSRKRLQKVVFLLQAAGCPLDADANLHHYGPYAPELARLSDEMVQVGLLEETSEQNPVGVQYSYALTERTSKELAELEQTPKGKKLAQQLAPYEEKAKDLLKTDLWLLEVASTVVYFRQQGHDWPDSVERTRKFKNLDPSSNPKFLKEVEELARQFIA